MGRSCSFIRLFGCPVGCWFCDTGYSPSDRKRLSDLPRYSLPYNTLRDQLKSKFVVISGGEPVYHPDLDLLLTKLIKDDFEVAIEEGATIIRIGTAIFGPRPNAKKKQYN